MIDVPQLIAIRQGKAAIRETIKKLEDRIGITETVEVNLLLTKVISKLDDMEKVIVGIK